MRTSGGRGLEGWILVVPVGALIVAATMNNGGADAMLISLEGTIRQTVTWVTTFLAGLL